MEEERRGGFRRGRFRGRGNFAPKPVKEGDEIDLTIEAVGEKGDGIGKIQGFVIFVPGTSTGESCKVKIMQVRGKSAVGEKI
ncbi:MAG: TRAM domain-containing protein [Candidatus Micrarchaeia archaeon]